MNVIFLDIDGVLNNCMAAGVFHPTSTDPLCIDILNHCLKQVDGKIVIISSWKDNYDFEVIRDLLYERGVLEGSIIDATTKDSQKLEGIVYFLIEKYFIEIESYVIIDDNLSFEGNYKGMEKFYVKTNSHTGLKPEDIDKILNKFK